MLECYQEKKEERSDRSSSVYFVAVKLAPQLTILSWLLIEKLVGFETVDQHYWHMG